MHSISFKHINNNNVTAILQYYHRLGSYTTQFLSQFLCVRNLGALS